MPEESSFYKFKAAGVISTEKEKLRVFNTVSSLFSLNSSDNLTLAEGIITSSFPAASEVHKKALSLMKQWKQVLQDRDNPDLLGNLEQKKEEILALIGTFKFKI